MEVLKWKQARFERDTRYYVIKLEQDMWESRIIIRRNGWIGSKLGRTREEFYEDYEKSVKRFEELQRYRIDRRKYCLVYEKF